MKQVLVAALTTIAIISAGILGWAAFAPETGCADPACARKRFSVFVELDTFRSVEPPPVRIAAADRVITPGSILRRGGVEVNIEYDQSELPYVAESGPLDRADLQEYAQVWRSRSVPANAQAVLYAMAAPALVSDSGERLFGVMFDVSGRESFAVAPAETRRVFRNSDEDSIAILQLRTFTHELLHALNRRHLDAAQISGRLTIEAPTRCISAVDARGGWSLVEEPLMSISPATIRFFQTASARDVLPGAAHTSFEHLRTSANECDDVRGNAAPRAALTRWDLTRKRLRRMFSMQAAYAQEPHFDIASDQAQEERPRVALRIQAQQAPYPLGYPIAIRVMVENTGTIALPLRGRLSPPYGLVQIERRVQGEEEWRAFRPLIFYEPASDEGAMLPLGASTEQTVAIFFGEEGWTFPQAGAYELRARLTTSDDDSDATSNVVRLSIVEPDAPEDRAVLQQLLNDNDDLDTAMGRFLMIGGRIGSEQKMVALETISGDFGNTALGSSLRLMLAINKINPPIDPRTGERPQAQLGDARELLMDTCADSGIAALKDELLQRFATAAPAEMTPGIEDSATAWDGATADHATLPTYSDPALVRFGPSVHFCLDDASFTGDTRTAARKLARELRRSKPQRIVVVGHTDYTASCRYNSALALKRAAAMKRVLKDAGVPSARILTLGLGERRPVSFSAAAAAHELNRRVEVLIEADNAAPASMPKSVLPRCRSRP